MEFSFQMETLGGGVKKEGEEDSVCYHGGIYGL